MSCCDCTSREGRKAIRGELALTSGDDDVYGWCMGWWFAIAETLYVTDRDAIPQHWGFRAAPSLDSDPNADETIRESYEGDRIMDLGGDGDVTSGDLVYWGNVLGRYARLCDAAGRSY
jgi:L-ascorbate metabolism protein UlaG (beta-lactamase superfamily)